MSTRGSSLQNNTAIAQIRLIDSRYDVIKEVSEHLLEIEQLAAEDIGALIDSLNEAKDFTGITVVAGTVASFDPETKIITVPTLKGDTGDTGAMGPTGPQGPIGLTGARGAQGAKGDTGAMGIQGPQGPTGPEGPAGIAGTDGADLTIEQISYNGNGVFTWQFSDGTSYTTPDLRGPQGATGLPGVKGDTGQGVHHIKGTSTTNPNGDFGTSPFKDTYTLYGDAGETINLGYFTVANGVSDGMSMEVYDTNNNGIVDNSERLGGELPGYYVNTVTNQTIGGVKTFSSTITGSISGNAATANKWTTARTITLSGDVAGSASVDGSANVTITTTVQPNSVALGTDTTGNYVAGVTAGTGIAVTGTAGEGWSPTVALSTVGTAGTYRSVTTDAYGRVTAGTNPTTVAGYGLTDVYTKTESDALLATKASLASPALIGIPTAPTANIGTNSTQIATTAYVVAEINKIEEW